MAFIEDFKKLQEQTPRLAIINTNSENSAYTNYSTFNRNCYLCSGTHYSEDVYYSQYCVGLTSCMDCFDVEKSELCYDLVFSEKCYSCSRGGYLVACSDCDYSFDLFNCQKCFLCSSIQNQSYRILNEPVAKEEYEERRRAMMRMYSPSELWQMLSDIRKKTPQRNVFQKNCENCAGSDLRNCKNIIESFAIKNGEDVIYGGTNCNQLKDACDVDNIAATMAQELYQGIGVTGSYNLMCCNVNWFSQNCYYCELIFNSHDCFGCISRNHAEYEILNVKYPKEEYFKKFEEIKKELGGQNMWGKMWMQSTYPYEDTIAAVYYPSREPFPAY